MPIPVPILNPKYDFKPEPALRHLGPLPFNLKGQGQRAGAGAALGDILPGKWPWLVHVSSAGRYRPHCEGTTGEVPM